MDIIKKKNRKRKRRLNNQEIFLLDTGQPVKIYDLDFDLIRLSGFESNKDIKVEIT